MTYTQPDTTAPVKPTGSPRWLAIIRDILISLVCLVFLAATVLVLVGVGRFADDVSNQFDNPSPSSNPVPPVCYIDPTDPSCPSGFDPNAGG